MKTKNLLATMLTTVFCAQLAAQPFQHESFPEGSYSPVTNINRSGYPRVLKDGSVIFRVQAPQAQQVQIDLCGTKYDMTKGEGGGYSWQGMQTFRSEMIDNIIPFVEKTYRVRKDRKSRAMCGLSMGGGQSFYIGLRDPEVFANVGVFSTGMFGGIRGASNFDLEKEVPGMLTDTKTFNKQFDVFFVSCGEQDPRIEYTRNIVKTMRDGGVEVRFNSYPGDHEWQVWRKSLHEFAQYLFK